uniref:Collagen IV NC1 domain-containing protein n=1 Tax=Megaselia scalaris TaxID=36166 RepID=T1GWP3_MEGSC
MHLSCHFCRYFQNTRVPLWVLRVQCIPDNPCLLCHRHHRSCNRNGDVIGRHYHGYDGPKGYRGDRGDTGDVGFQGDRGSPGYNGVDGNNGPKGEKGFPGNPGLKGESGIFDSDSFKKDAYETLKSDPDFFHQFAKNFAEEVKKLRLKGEKGEMGDCECLKCILCSDNHQLASCSKFKTKPLNAGTS